MRLARHFRLSLRRVFLRPANIPAVIALCVVVSAAIFAERQNYDVFLHDQRTEVLNELSLIRSRLEGNINADMQLVRGLVSVISTEPDMDQTRFSSLAASLFVTQHELINVAAAPDLVVSLIHPLKGNQQALGLDYNQNAAQRDAALKARDTRQLVLAGPVDLVQGGTGFIGRFPVFLDRPDGGTRFWGMVSTVIDAEKLFVASGLGADTPLDIAITGKDASGPDGPQFYGSDTILQNNPVTAIVTLPSGSWQLSAIPEGGWSATPDNLWIIRGFSLLAGLLVVVPILAAGWLIGERYGYLRKLQASRNELQRLSQRLELALRTSEIGVWENDLTREKLYWDARMRVLYDAPAKDPVTLKDWSRRLHPEDFERATEEFRIAVETGEQYHSVFRIVLDNGDIRTVRAMGAVYEDEQGKKRIIGVNWDISRDVKRNAQLQHERAVSEARNTELESTRARLEYNALHDSLTGLPNRRYLDELLAGRSDLEFAPDTSMGLLHIDLDRFKQINDTLGHAAGDAMLVHTANVLLQNVRNTDFVARIGGDEFVVVSLSETNEQHLGDLANRIVEQMRLPVVYQGRECRFGVSVGIACHTGGNPQDLLINADIALYRAKKEGRNGYRFFSKSLHSAAINAKRIADEILIGIEQSQFVAHYQGQFDSATCTVTGVEALARWQHPEKGLLTPDVFINIAEDLNVMAEIDRMVLEHSLAQMKKWQRAGTPVPRVAVNVSARRLRDENLVASLSKLKIKPGTVAFELVESIFLDDNDDLVTWNIDRIKDLGIDIEIDDFGTGYASIVSLMQLRPKRLKIDRQLVFPANESANQRELVRSIVTIGTSLGIETVAEGIETMDHARIMHDLGCTTLQGYALARPMSGRDFTRFMRENNGRAASAA